MWLNDFKLGQGRRSVRLVRILQWPNAVTLPPYRYDASSKSQNLESGALQCQYLTHNTASNDHNQALMKGDLNALERQNVAWLNISMKNSRYAIVMQKLEIFTLAENFRNLPCEQIIPKVNHLQVLASTPIARKLAFQYHPWSPKNFKIRQSRYTIRNSTLETIEVINVDITLTTLLHSNRVERI
ncbi:hypothetical protein IEQ34_002835 [Dendrobium chrysotoxum]|uniref:Uncharacterized protein n=1 Tax=Dendrobium chrysotoxum TaxID=161865 RepID=A0AAV7HFZ7_DENCH|nr:hypothetical protein IEQ34_002835 [Dendrobium chrysotoxum]